MLRQGGKKMRNQNFFTVRQAAFEVNRHPDTIYRWIQEGFLQNIVRVRDGYLIPKTEIQRLKVPFNPSK